MSENHSNLSSTSHSQSAAQKRQAVLKQQHELNTFCKLIHSRTRLVLLFISCDFALLTLWSFFNINLNQIGSTKIDINDPLYEPCLEKTDCLHGKLDLISFNSAFVWIFALGPVSAVFGFWNSLKRRSTQTLIFAVRCLVFTALACGWSVWFSVLASQPNTKTIENGSYGMVAIAWACLATFEMTGFVLSLRLALTQRRHSELLGLVTCLVRPKWNFIVQLPIMMIAALCVLNMGDFLFNMWHMSVHLRADRTYLGVELTGEDPVKFHMINVNSFAQISYEVVSVGTLIIGIFAIRRSSMVLCRLLIVCCVPCGLIHSLDFIPHVAKGAVSWGTVHLLGQVIYMVACGAAVGFYRELVATKRRQKLFVEQNALTEIIPVKYHPKLTPTL